LAEVDILGPSDRRRVWSAQEKAALLAEIDAEGGKVRLVARRHRMSESLLYNWRSARKAEARALGAPENIEFLPVGVIDDCRSGGPPVRPSPCPEPTTQQLLTVDGKVGSIEIMLQNGARVSVDAFVNEKALSRVLRAMKAMA